MSGAFSLLSLVDGFVIPEFGGTLKSHLRSCFDSFVSIIASSRRSAAFFVFFVDVAVFQQASSVLFRNLLVNVFQ